MSDENNQKNAGSFWTTLPGCLTGIAAVITAIGGILTILYTVGLLKLPENSLPETPTPVSAPGLSFTGTWQGDDPDDGSTISLILKQAGNTIEGTFSDTFSKQTDGTMIRPGWWGNGTGSLSSPSEARMSFDLARSSDSLKLDVRLILSNQNDTLTLEIPQSSTIILKRQQ
jgi:hypothetical protein